MSNKHLEDVSLCGLFLMEAAKKADAFFQVPPPSTQHMVRDATTDIQAMVADLLSSSAVKTQENPRSTVPPFQDPSTVGMENKASAGWIESALQGGWEEEECTEEDAVEGEIDFSYELYHTT